MSESPNGSTALVPAPRPNSSWMVVRNLAEAIQLAEIVYKSNAFPDVRSAAMAVVKIMAGAEMGFGPFASLADVHVIEGKPAVGAHLRAAAVKGSSNYDYRVLESSSTRCELEFFERRGAGAFEPVGRVVMTLQEAIDSGLAVKEKDKNGQAILKRNWRVHPDDMLFARAISKGYRRYCPDLSGGVLAYTPEELDSEETPTAPLARLSGPVLDADFTPAQTPPATPKPPQLSLADLAREHQRSLDDLAAVLAAIDEPNGTIHAVPPAKESRVRVLLVQGVARSVQVDRIAELARQLGIWPDKLQARLKEKYHVERLPALTKVEADEIEAKLRAALEAKGAPA